MNFFEVDVKGNEMFNDNGLGIKITEGHSKILQKKDMMVKKLFLEYDLKIYQAEL